MAYLLSSEISSHMYDENIQTITRGDDTIVTAAIDAAIAEAKGYLNRYDTARIFAAVGDKRNQLLLIFIKDIAVWHLITLCNVGTDMEFREKRYERAVDWLKAVQKGNVNPDLPLLDTGTSSTSDAIGPIIFGSNPKRNNHF